MENPIVGILTILVVLFLGIIAVRIAFMMLFGFLHLVMPLLILSALIYVVYRVANKSLSGGRRTLP